MKHIEQQPVRFMDRELFPHAVHILRGMAEVVGCRPEGLVPMPNVTTAMNTVLRSWQHKHQPGPQDRIAHLQVAYGSTKKLISEIAVQTGASVDEVPIKFPIQDEEDVLEALADALTTETTLVVLDHIPSNAPFVLPLDQAVEICRDRAPNAFVMVDAAHSLLGTPLALEPPLADALVTNCHKWFCGPKGTAVLHVDPQHQEWIKPIVISHGYNADWVSGFYWSGLTDFSSWLALDATLAFWEAVGMHQARLYSQSIVRDAADSLVEAWGTELGAPADMFGMMSLVELPPIPALGSQDAFEYAHAEAVQNSLFQQKIEVPIKVLSGKMYVRISAHIYNELDDFVPLRDAVLELSHGAEL